MKNHRFLVAGMLVLVGCVIQKQPSDDEGILVSVSGLEIGVAVNTGGETDVASIEYRIDRVACFDGEEYEPLSVTSTTTLEDESLPPEFADSPLNSDAKHPFADHFEVVPAGCYDIQATPLMGDGTASADCAAAIAHDIEVLDGETTEVFMLSQCKGAEVGAVDAVVAFNRPPNLINLTYTPSKFISKDEKVTVCAAAMDPNGDAIEFEWMLQNGGECSGPTISSSVTDADGVTIECVDITPNETGKYWFEVWMYDLIQNEEGTVVRIEDWLAENGYPNDSHDKLRFPLYVSDAAPTEETEEQTP